MVDRELGFQSFQERNENPTRSNEKTKGCEEATQSCHQHVRTSPDQATNREDLLEKGIATQDHQPAVIHWAWEQGVAGLDYRKVRDQAGDIGSLVHYLILCALGKVS